MLLFEFKLKEGRKWRRKGRLCVWDCLRRKRKKTLHKASTHKRMKMILWVSVSYRLCYWWQECCGLCGVWNRNWSGPEAPQNLIHTLGDLEKRTVTTHSSRQTSTFLWCSVSKSGLTHFMQQNSLTQGQRYLSSGVSGCSPSTLPSRSQRRGETGSSRNPENTVSHIKGNSSVLTSIQQDN